MTKEVISRYDINTCRDVDQLRRYANAKMDDNRELEAEISRLKSRDTYFNGVILAARTRFWTGIAKIVPTVAWIIAGSFGIYSVIASTILAFKTFGIL